MLVMENAEEVMQILERFTRLKQKEIPKELDDYLHYVAKTGDTVFKWANLKYLFREKLLNVMKNFYDTTPRVDEIPQYPNVDPFNYENMKSALLERLELFNAAPFTIQRLCELLIDPRKQYNRIDKFMRALEKNILVVSTIEPGRKRSESENGDSLDSVVNGDLSLDVNVDIDMEGESLFNMENASNAQNGDSGTSASNNLPAAEPEAKSKQSSGAVKKEHSPSPEDEVPVAKKAKLDIKDDEPKTKDTDVVKLDGSSENKEKVEQSHTAANEKKEITSPADDVLEEKEENKTEEIKKLDDKIEETKQKSENIEVTKEEKSESPAKLKDGDADAAKNGEEDQAIELDAAPKDEKNDENKENAETDVDESKSVAVLNAVTVAEALSPVMEGSKKLKDSDKDKTKEEISEGKNSVEKDQVNDKVSSVDEEVAKGDSSNKDFDGEEKKIESSDETKDSENPVKATKDTNDEKTSDAEVVIAEGKASKAEDKSKECDVKISESSDKTDAADDTTSSSAASSTEKTADPIEVPSDVEAAGDSKSTDAPVEKIEAVKLSAEIGKSIDSDSKSTIPASVMEESAADIVKDEAPQVVTKTDAVSTTTTATSPPVLALNDQPMDDVAVEEAEPATVDEVVMSENSGGTVEMATDAMEASKDEPAGMDVDDTSQEAMDQ